MLLPIRVIDSRGKRGILCNLFNLPAQSPIIICFGAFFLSCTILLALTTCLRVIRADGDRLIKFSLPTLLKWSYQD